jgi:simple sugar transport system permease protein
MEDVLAGVLATAVASGTVIAFAALGEVLTERTGVLNLGLEGIMAMGAVSAIIAVNVFSTTAFAGLVTSAIVGLLLGAMFAVATVIFKANQVLSGLALTFFGIGLAGLLGAPYAGQPAQARFQRVPIPLLSDIPVLGRGLFNHNVLVYFAFLLLPIIITYVLYRTRHGLSIRAVGENPSAADASGIGVTGLRFFYTSIGAGLSAMAGAYLTLAFIPSWAEGVTGGRGWIAIALVIFAGWRPIPIVLGALLFGAVTSLGFVAQLRDWGIPTAFLSMLPYLSTLLLMLIPFISKRRGERRMGTAPDALGLPYFREEG